MAHKGTRIGVFLESLLEGATLEAVCKREKIVKISFPKVLGKPNEVDCGDSIFQGVADQSF